MFFHRSVQSPQAFLFTINEPVQILKLTVNTEGEDKEQKETALSNPAILHYSLAFCYYNKY